MKASGHVDALGNFAELGRFLGRDGDGLFAEHMLAGPGGRQGQRHMQMVGQRVVDRLDFRVFQHGLIGAVGLGDAELRGCGLGGFELARGDGDDLDSRLFSMPGMTFSMPILAVEMMPHFTGFMTFLLAVLP